MGRNGPLNARLTLIVRGSALRLKVQWPEMVARCACDAARVHHHAGYLNTVDGIDACDELAQAHVHPLCCARR